MPLLFAVSGMGARYAMRTRPAAAFIRERLARLGIPFATASEEACARYPAVRETRRIVTAAGYDQGIARTRSGSYVLEGEPSGPELYAFDLSRGQAKDATSQTPNVGGPAPVPLLFSVRLRAYTGPRRRAHRRPPRGRACPRAACGRPHPR